MDFKEWLKEIKHIDFDSFIKYSDSERLKLYDECYNVAGSSDGELQTYIVGLALGLLESETIWPRLVRAKCEEDAVYAYAHQPHLRATAGCPKCYAKASDRSAKVMRDKIVASGYPTLVYNYSTHMIDEDLRDMNINGGNTYLVGVKGSLLSAMKMDSVRLVKAPYEEMAIEIYEKQMHVDNVDAIMCEELGIVFKDNKYTLEAKKHPTLINTNIYR